jgi:hypothetical protein
MSHVRQYLELQVVLLDSGERCVWEFRRDGDECDALGMELIEVLLQGSQGEIARGAPFSAIEGYK